jgi:hypothetical protein
MAEKPEVIPHAEAPASAVVERVAVAAAGGRNPITSPMPDQCFVMFLAVACKN